MATHVRGVDLLIYLKGDHDHKPKSFEMTKKMTVEQVKAELGETTTVFLANKNLQKYPKGLRGSLIWVPLLAVVGYVVCSTNVSAVLSVLYPYSKKGKRYLTG
jgi:hypothetical protein